VYCEWTTTENGHSIVGHSIIIVVTLSELTTNGCRSVPLNFPNGSTLKCCLLTVSLYHSSMNKDHQWGTVRALL